MHSKLTGLEHKSQQLAKFNTILQPNCTCSCNVPLRPQCIQTHYIKLGTSYTRLATTACIVYSTYDVLSRSWLRLKRFLGLRQMKAINGHGVIVSKRQKIPSASPWVELDHLMISHSKKSLCFHIWYTNFFSMRQQET